MLTRTIVRTFFGTPAAFLLAALIACVKSERVFHARDGSDVEAPLVPEHIFSVTSYGEALTYLENYGYLNCTISRQKRDLIHNLHEALRGNGESKPDCTQENIEEGFTKLQNRFHLPVTGEFDPSTQNIMSSKRCGNPDDEESDLERDAAEDEDEDEESFDENAASRVRRGTLKNRLSALTADDETAAPFIHNLEEAIVDHEEVERTRRAMLHKIHKRKQREAKSRKHKSGRRMTRKRRMREAVRQQLGPRSLRRQKRTIQLPNITFSEDTTSSRKMARRIVTWKISDEGKSTKIPKSMLAGIIMQAFRRFSEVAPIRFRETSGEADVIVGFARGSHMACPWDFDGPGGQLAHSFFNNAGVSGQYLGSMHFDDAETYEDQFSGNENTGIILIKVAVHEAGHIAGLPHSEERMSVMYPVYYQTPQHRHVVEITRQDRINVQRLYGICKTRFNVAFDWVHAKFRNGDTIYRFSSYFVAGSKYWLYENRYGRPRHGDPRDFSPNWGYIGVIDGAAQIIQRNGNGYDIYTYFFKDDMYILFNDTANVPVAGYPKRISEGFGPKNGSNQSIPNKIDSVYYDDRDGFFYFFKGTMVYVYEAALIGRNGCCEKIVPFSSHFITSPDEALEGNIDVAYRSFARNALFFLVGQDVYENIGFSTRVAANNYLIKHDIESYHIWRDICDPEFPTSS